MNEEIDKLIRWLSTRKDKDETTTLSILHRKVMRLYDLYSKKNTPDWYL